MSRLPLGLYLHVPFCRQRCDFCAFYLEIHRDSRAINFLNALKSEICRYGATDLASRHTIRSIYFGGGTPTTLSPRDLQEILTEIRRCFTVASDAEVSIEAHPATVTDGMLVHLVQAGFNRISFGAESMEDQDFSFIGRRGSVRETVGAVAMARAAGFANINLDLMYGLPGQSLTSWQRTLKHVITLNPTHLSCYALTIEEGTKLAGSIAARTIIVPDETSQIEMDETADEMLHGAGYIRYEISNYAKSGYACRHNLLYWTNGAYLGLGPSAESYVNGCRFGNIADLSLYEQAL
ncbi:MAG TPA: radical SAM family heme chaperone HemW, partial [Nitrospiraceae bacterium]